MALPDSVKRVRGTTLVFSNSGEYVPTVVAGAPTGTDADLDLGALGTGGVARQPVKLDLGSVNLDVELEIRPYIEFHSAPTAGGTQRADSASRSCLSDPIARQASRPRLSRRNASDEERRSNVAISGR